MSRARLGMGLFRFLVLVVLTAVLIALGVGAWANYDEDRDGDGKPDGLTFHMLDPTWWGATRDEVKPMLRRMRSKAMEMREEIWADDGLVDNAQQWLESSRQGRKAMAEMSELSATGRDPLHQPSGPEVGNRSQTVARRKEAERDQPAAAQEAEAAGPTPPPGGREVALPPLTSNPIADLPQAPLLHLEDNIGDASEYFAIGLVAYKQAKPMAEEWAPEAEAKFFEAQVHFRSVRALLDGTLEEYARRQDHDPELLDFGRGLLERSNGLLLESI